MGPAQHKLPFPNAAPDSFGELSLPLDQSRWDFRVGKVPGVREEAAVDASAGCHAQVRTAHSGDGEERSVLLGQGRGLPSIEASPLA